MSSHDNVAESRPQRGFLLGHPMAPRNWQYQQQFIQQIQYVQLRFSEPLTSYSSFFFVVKESAKQGGAANGTYYAA